MNDELTGTYARSWTDWDGTMRAEVRIVPVTLRRMHPDRLKLLVRAGELIQRALAEPEEPTVEGEMRRAVEAPALAAVRAAGGEER